ncbi:myelin and lymphocyte protein-like [Phalacrocorax aristotelis]|uniref:myelin and lymphocyte protein-like n=1 Tax=Phalacrocorax aristotelis TaxID=126867 RepID=UPI003F4B4021
MSSATSTTSLPSGLAVLTTFPDVLFIPEIIFGGLVWILVASSKVQLPMLQGWVMFVSVFCFVMSITLLCLYICGAHGGSSSWVTLAVICQETASLFYLSMAVLEAYSTYISFGPANAVMMTVYQENVAAVVSAWQAGEGEGKATQQERFGDPDGTISVRLQDPLSRRLPWPAPENSLEGLPDSADPCGGRQGPLPLSLSLSLGSISLRMGNQQGGVLKKSPLGCILAHWKDIGEHLEVVWIVKP